MTDSISPLRLPSFPLLPPRVRMARFLDGIDTDCLCCGYSLY